MECANCQSEIAAGESRCLRCGWEVPSTADLFARLNSVFSGRYDFLRLLGIGGFAEVYLARDVLLEREVAVKILLPQHAQDPQTVERFLREARLYAKLEHANIIPVYDTGVVQGHVFITMKYIRGDSLKRVLATQRRLDPRLLPTVAAGVAQALAYIHRQGIVHRDIKPANIIIEKATCAVYLADFGIARAESSQTLTQTGMIVGTPHYLAPEQIQGKRIDARSDIYALGATLYELASGQPPFRGDSPLEILYQHINENAVPLNRLVPEIDPLMERIISRCIVKDPARRFQQADEIAALIERSERSRSAAAQATALTAPTPQRRRRGARALAGAVLIGAMAIAAFLFWPRPPRPSPGTAAQRLPTRGVSAPTTLARDDGQSQAQKPAPVASAPTGQATEKSGPHTEKPVAQVEKGQGQRDAAAQQEQPATPPSALTAKKPREADPLPGTVRFSSFPPAAEVYWKGEKIGSTEQLFEKKFPAGTQVFQFAIPGYQSADVSLTVASGATVSAHHRFPPFRNFTVTARPFGRIQVDGKEYGDTPQIIKLAFGEHLVRVSKDGYRASEQRIMVDPGSKNSVHFELEKEEGK